MGNTWKSMKLSEQTLRHFFFKRRQLDYLVISLLTEVYQS